jgi:hypothetical protein
LTSHRNQPAPTRPGGRTLLLTLLAASLALLWPAAATAETQAIRLVRPPRFVHLEVADLHDVFSDAAMTRARAAGDAVPAAPERLLVVRLVGVPMVHDRLAPADRAAVARKRYEGRIRDLLQATIDHARRAGATHLSVADLPREHGDAASVDATNARYAPLIESLDALVARRSFILTRTAGEPARLRRAMPRTFALADDRPILYRANRTWRAIGGGPDAAAAAGTEDLPWRPAEDELAQRRPVLARYVDPAAAAARADEAGDVTGGADILITSGEASRDVPDTVARHGHGGGRVAAPAPVATGGQVASAAPASLTVTEPASRRPAGDPAPAGDDDGRRRRRGSPPDDDGPALPLAGDEPTGDGTGDCSLLAPPGDKRLIHYQSVGFTHETAPGLVHPDVCAPGEGWNAHVRNVLEPLVDRLGPGTFDWWGHWIAGIWAIGDDWDDGYIRRRTLFEGLAIAREEFPELADFSPMAQYAHANGVGLFAYIGLPMCHDSQVGIPDWQRVDAHCDPSLFMHWYGEFVINGFKGVGHDLAAGSGQDTLALDSNYRNLRSLGVDPIVESMPWDHATWYYGFSAVAEYWGWELADQHPDIFTAEQVRARGGRAIHLVVRPGDDDDDGGDLQQWRFDLAKELLLDGHTVAVPLDQLAAAGLPIEELLEASLAQ